MASFDTDATDTKAESEKGSRRFEEETKAAYRKITPNILKRKSGSPPLFGLRTEEEVACLGFVAVDFELGLVLGFGQESQ
jgi:hypothetical protein